MDVHDLPLGGPALLKFAIEAAESGNVKPLRKKLAQLLGEACLDDTIDPTIECAKEMGQLQAANLLSEHAVQMLHSALYKKPDGEEAGLFLYNYVVGYLAKAEFAADLVFPKVLVIDTNRLLDSARKLDLPRNSAFYVAPQFVQVSDMILPQSTRYLVVRRLYEQFKTSRDSPGGAQLDLGHKGGSRQLPPGAVASSSETFTPERSLSIRAMTFGIVVSSRTHRDVSASLCDDTGHFEAFGRDVSEYLRERLQFPRCTSLIVVDQSVALFGDVKERAKAIWDRMRNEMGIAGT